MVKKVIGIGCIVLSALLVVAAVNSLNKPNHIAVTDQSGLGVSAAVGAFLPSFIAFIVGLSLLRKPKLPIDETAPDADRAKK